MKNSKYVLIILMFLMTLTFVACSSSAEQELDEKEREAVVSKDDEVRIVNHAMGVTEIKGTPKRVVTLYQGATDTALALGVTPVGVVESWVQKPMYTYLSDKLSGVPIIGLETQPNLEEIAKLNPDLIIASKIRHEKIYEQLSQIAPTVSHETVFKFKETTELLGNALNKEDEANKLLADWNTRVTKFNENVKAELSDTWPIEVSVLNFRTDHARIYVTGFAGDILKDLGFVRSEIQTKAAEEGKVVVKLTSTESIPSMDGDMFFTFAADGHNPDADAIQQTVDAWTSHPLWNQLRAVKNDKNYMVDDVAWNMGGGIIAANNMLDQLYEIFEIDK